MLARLNTSTEISLFPTGLGNHYTSANRNLVPPGRRRFPAYNSASEAADPGLASAAADHSFREPRERFGPDVLVIAGLAMACAGAALTLVSLYLEFRHPAIQATMAGVGPSLVGIGMLFCVLRLFFCTFCVSRTCCERLRLGSLFSRTPKVHPLRVKDTGAKKALVANGQQLFVNGDSSLPNKDNRQQNNNSKDRQQPLQNNNNIDRQQQLQNNNIGRQQLQNNNIGRQQQLQNNNTDRQQQLQNNNNNNNGERQQQGNNGDSLQQQQKALVLGKSPARIMDPIREERRTPESEEEDRGGVVSGDEDMILRDEIDLLDSPRLHEDINDLVRKTGRY